MYNNYRYFITNNKVIAISKDGGKTIRGYAKCSPEDDFDIEYGKKLAAARCNVKVATRRMKRAEAKCLSLGKEMAHLNRYMVKANISLEEEYDKLVAANAYLSEVSAKNEK